MDTPSGKSHHILHLKIYRTTGSAPIVGMKKSISQKWKKNRKNMSKAEKDLYEVYDDEEIKPVNLDNLMKIMLINLHGDTNMTASYLHSFLEKNQKKSLLNSKKWVYLLLTS